MIVVTLRVPRTERDELAVSVRDHTVTVTGSRGFARELTLSPEADTERLHALLYHEILELRVPRGPLPVARPVTLDVLR